MLMCRCILKAEGRDNWDVGALVAGQAVLLFGEASLVGARVVLCCYTLSFAATRCPLLLHFVLCCYTLSFAATRCPLLLHVVLCCLLMDPDATMYNKYGTGSLNSV